MSSKSASTPTAYRIAAEQGTSVYAILTQIQQDILRAAPDHLGASHRGNCAHRARNDLPELGTIADRNRIAATLTCNYEEINEPSPVKLHELLRLDYEPIESATVDRQVCVSWKNLACYAGQGVLT